MKYRITIPEPCHENWDKMTPTEKGRFCAVCEKNLVDFTTYSTQALFREVSASSGNVCGRFRNDQLERLIYEKPHKKTGVVKYALTSLLAVLAVKNSTAKVVEAINTAEIESSNHSPGLKEPILLKYTLTVKGTLVDTTGLPYGNDIQVFIKELPYETLTGQKGEFKFLIREKIELDSVTFVVSPPSGEWFEIKVSTKRLYAKKPLTLVISSQKMQYCISSVSFGVVSIVDEKGTTLQPYPIEKPARASLWKRIGNWFRWVF